MYLYLYGVSCLWKIYIFDNAKHPSNRMQYNFMRVFGKPMIDIFRFMRLSPPYSTTTLFCTVKDVFNQALIKDFLWIMSSTAICQIALNHCGQWPVIIKIANKTILWWKYLVISSLSSCSRIDKSNSSQSLLMNFSSSETVLAPSSFSFFLQLWTQCCIFSYKWLDATMRKYFCHSLQLICSGWRTISGRAQTLISHQQHNKDATATRNLKPIQIAWKCFLYSLLQTACN